MLGVKLTGVFPLVGLRVSQLHPAPSDGVTVTLPVELVTLMGGTLGGGVGTG
jgi:hypothetical protein